MTNADLYKAWKSIGASVSFMEIQNGIVITLPDGTKFAGKCEQATKDALSHAHDTGKKPEAGDSKDGEA